MKILDLDFSRFYFAEGEEEDLWETIVRPLYDGSFYVVLSFLLNFLVCSMSDRAPPKFLLIVAFYFGFGYQFLLATIDVFEFWFFTICLFMVFFIIAIILNKVLGWRYYYVLKFLVFLTACFCFQFYVNKPNIEEFVLTYLVLSIKLLNAVDAMNTEGDEVLKFFSILSYLAYTPWLTFKHFLFLTENFQTWRDKDWWYMVTTSWLNIMTYKLLAHNIVKDETLPNFYIKPQVLLMFRSFQYRSKYYYLTMIGDLELLAAGVKKKNWKETYICEPIEAEMSLSCLNFAREINRPATMFFLTKACKGKLKIEKLAPLVDLVMVLILLYCYNIQYGYLCTLFAVNMYLEQCALITLENTTHVCVFSCPALCCEHYNVPNEFLYFYIKTLVCIYNKYTVSLLFVKSAADIAESIYLMYFLLGVNFITTALPVVFDLF